VNERTRQLLLTTADDELVLGWRESEWTGIAPVLEEDVALSSIAQNEIGHARAIYQLLADDADALAFDWARTIARRVLYEAADELRLRTLMSSDDPDVAGLAAKIDREEAYHRMHAELWHERLGREQRYRAALEELFPYALGLLEADQRAALAARFDLAKVDAVERGPHADGWAKLWEEMTEVRRSVPGAAW
jgi:ring-1,2-phenylacetyl-CoA epoxidase subunit PaaC